MRRTNVAVAVKKPVNLASLWLFSKHVFIFNYLLILIIYSNISSQKHQMDIVQFLKREER